MSDFWSTERLRRLVVGRRRLMLTLLAPGLLAACGKKGVLRLPRPGELEDEDKAKSKSKPQTEPQTAPAAPTPETAPQPGAPP